jgi:catechol 2,3-dioxygenase-like lactoylglutathione lyase family enzyme
MKLATPASAVSAPIQPQWMWPRGGGGSVAGGVDGSGCGCGCGCGCAGGCGSGSGGGSGSVGGSGEGDGSADGAGAGGGGELPPPPQATQNVTIVRKRVMAPTESKGHASSVQPRTIAVRGCTAAPHLLPRRHSLWSERRARLTIRRMAAPPSTPPALGLCHLALNVADVARSEAFYVGLLGFTVEWRPDPDNLYLRRGADNLALHRHQPRDPDDEAAFQRRLGQHLAHLGMAVLGADDVDAWANHVRPHVKILSEPRTHRDGARSFYFEDPDGNVVQILHHLPIVDAVAGKPYSP